MPRISYRDEAIEMFNAGYSNREVAYKFNIAMETASKYRNDPRVKGEMTELRNDAYYPDNFKNDWEKYRKIVLKYMKNDIPIVKIER